MATSTPYQPRRRRQAPSEGLRDFWQGLYLACVLGLPIGAAAWGLVALGGGPVLASRERAVISLLGCGLTGALAAASWGWGARWLDRHAMDLVRAIADRLQPLLQRLAPGPDDEPEPAAISSYRCARALLAWPVGIPGALARVLGARGAATTGLTTTLLLIGAAGWIIGLRLGALRLLAPVPLPPPPPSPAETLHAAREEALFDSSLQLAVAKAKRAKSAGDNAKAIAVLEGALRDAQAEGRSVAHAELHWYLAWLYAAEGDTAAALVMFQTVQELAEPGSKMATEADRAVQRLSRKARGMSAPPVPEPDVAPPAGAEPAPEAGD